MRFVKRVWLVSFFIFFHLPATCYYPCESDCIGEYDCLCHIFYGVQGLCWKICESDFRFATDQELEKGHLKKGKVHALKPDWNAGVRGLFGWNWYCGWEVDIVYTYYCKHFEGHVSNKKGAVALSALLFSTDSGVDQLAKKASCKRSYEYQTLDALIGKSLLFSETMVVLNPFFGVRGLKLNKRCSASYKDHEFEFPGKVKWQSAFDAAGLHAGIAMQLILKCGFSVYGGVAGSLLASKSDQELRQKILYEDRAKIAIKEKKWISLPGLHLFAGLIWNRCLERCLFYNIKIGYEFNNWQNIEGLRRLDQRGVAFDDASKNFALHGGTFGVGIYF